MIKTNLSSLCQPARGASCRLKVDNGKTLEGIVDAYLEHNWPDAERYIQFYKKQPTLDSAIRRSALAELPSGKRHPHQRRIPRKTLERAKDALMELNYDGIDSFETLYSLALRTILSIDGIGPLTVYDTVHRLGAFLRLSPNYVYLHAGVIKGARALGISTKQERISVSELPRAFQKLTPEQVEDCLCIYKNNLAKWRDATQRVNGS